MTKLQLTSKLQWYGLDATVSLVYQTHKHVTEWGAPPLKSELMPRYV